MTFSFMSAELLLWIVQFVFILFLTVSVLLLSSLSSDWQVSCLYHRGLEFCALIIVCTSLMLSL